MAKPYIQIDDNVYLHDDGTLDTVIIVNEVEEYRYSQELVAEYRDENGELDLDLFLEEVVYPELEA